MAFVLIQHLDPKHESHLTELLSKASKMPVSEVKGETRARGQSCLRDSAAMQSGHFRWSPAYPAPAGQWPQHADRLFSPRPGGRPRQQGRSASFCREPHRMGRWASRRSRPRAASPSLRKWEPRSSTACREAPSPPVWWILFCRRPESRGNWRPSRAILMSRSSLGRRLSRRGIAELAKILRLVRSATGVDFTHYKHSTLARRIKRRMALRGFETLEDYSRDLERNREEANALCENCLITVTAFFREPAVFEELKKKVFPALVENRGPEDPIRIWVPGCATGEEAYSIAICLMEFLDDTKAEPSVRDFRHRYQRNGDRKSPRRHIHGRRVGPCLAAAIGAVLHPNGTRVPDCEDHP